MIIVDSLLPPAVMDLLLQIMALPNSDLARSSAARVLGKCNCFGKLVPLFMSWMKKRVESIIPARTAASLEFPEMEMVSVLSVLFPIEKLLDWTNSIEEDFLLESRCIEILDCLVVGGRNISHMLSDDLSHESGGILMKIMRCLNARDFPNMQCKAVDALQACGLTHFGNVANDLLKIFKTDNKCVVRARLADAIFHRDMDRGFRMEVSSIIGCNPFCEGRGWFLFFVFCFLFLSLFSSHLFSLSSPSLLTLFSLSSHSHLFSSHPGCPRSSPLARPPLHPHAPRRPVKMHLPPPPLPLEHRPPNPLRPPPPLLPLLPPPLRRPLRPAQRVNRRRLPLRNSGAILPPLLLHHLPLPHRPRPFDPRPLLPPPPLLRLPLLPPLPPRRVLPRGLGRGPIPPGPPPPPNGRGVLPQRSHGVLGGGGPGANVQDLEGVFDQPVPVGSASSQAHG